VYTVEEVYEMFFNICNIEPYIVNVPLEDVYEMYNSPWFSSWWVREVILILENSDENVDVPRVDYF
jgi:hypothetical protein